MKGMSGRLFVVLSQFISNVMQRIKLQHLKKKFPFAFALKQGPRTAATTTFHFSLFIFYLLLASACYASLPGSGTSSNPYRIESLTNFQEFTNYANASQYWSANIYTELTTDLNLGNTTYFQAPIGGELLNDQLTSGFQGTGYSGHFNGNGHSISSFIMQDIYGTESHLALFGMLNSTASVSNVKVTNVMFNPSNNTTCMAAIAASNYGDVSNCSVNINASSPAQAFKIGAIAGYNQGLIADCFAEGQLNLSETHYLGGICGYNEAVIQASASDITITGHTNVGGICGSTVNAEVSDCYSLKLITGENSVAGISGLNLNSIVTRCYSTSQIQADFYPGEVVGLDFGTEIDCYYLNMIELDALSDATPLSAEQMYLAENYSNWDFSDNDGNPAIWTELTDDFPILQWQVRLVSMPDLTGLDLPEAENAIFNAFLNLGVIVYQSSATVREGAVISSTPSAGLSLREGAAVSLVVSAGTPYSGGDGSADSPFLLANPSDIIELYNTPSDNSKHFLMIADISMQGQTFQTALIAPDGGTVFDGDFDGDSHAITDINIDTNAGITTSYNNSYLGLFGLVGTPATIKNLSVSGTIQTTGINEYVGGLCASNSGTITNCNSDFNIITNSYVGAICGMNQLGGTIDKCFSSGSITGNEYLGGFCGLNDGNITLSFANANVTAYNNGQYGGAFCGRGDVNSVISNCYSNGSISCGVGAKNIGGFCGDTFGEIDHCYCSGMVIPASNCTDLGFFCSSVFAAISNCYYLSYDSDIISNNIAQPLSATEMRDSSSFTGWDFSNTWHITLGNYPQIRTYDSADINQDRKVDLSDLAVLAGQWLSD